MSKNIKKNRTKQNIDASIIVITYNRSSFLNYCLEHLMEFKKYDLNIEIVVVDNASTDDTPAVMATWIKKEPDLIRYTRQTQNVGGAKNAIAAIGLAKGFYTIYCADDDLLIVDQCVSYIKKLKKEPNVVALYAPSLLWNDNINESCESYPFLDKTTYYNQKDSLNLLQDIIDHNLFLEIGIFKTDVLQSFIHLTKGNWWCFLWLYHFLRKGDICLSPTPFYKEITYTNPALGTRERMSTDNATKMLDTYRGGLESLAFMVLNDMDVLGRDHIDFLCRLSYKINLFMMNRYIVGVRYGILSHDLITAQELTWRAMLWDPNAKELSTNSMHVVLMYHILCLGVIDIFTSSSWLNTLILSGIESPDIIQDMFKSIKPDLDCKIATIDEIKSMDDQDKLFVWVGTDDQKSALSHTSIPLGHIVTTQQLSDIYIHAPFHPSAVGYYRPTSDDQASWGGKKVVAGV